MMKNYFLKILILAVFGVSCITIGDAWAAEDLFDVKGARVLFNQGMKELAAGQYGEAIESMEESAAVYPEAETFYYLGYAYYLKGKSGEEDSRVKSVENFERAYELDPGFTPKIKVEVVEAGTKGNQPADSGQPAAAGQNQAADASQPGN